jgi:hypothetical protein
MVFQFHLSVRKLTKFVCASVLTLGLFSECGHKENSQTPPAGMHALDLSRFGKPFVIFVPDTVKNQFEVIEQSSGALEIRSGKAFGISINEQAADLDLLKKDLKDDEVNKLKSFIKDEPNSLMWESEVVQPEFHFFINKKVGDRDFSFEDIKSTDLEPFGKAAVETMFESSKNIQPLQKQND